MAAFAFAVVRPGAEPLLKDEIKEKHPQLRFAFSRPGLLTYKDPRGEVTPEFGADLIFARVAGASLGVTRDVASIEAALERVASPVRLHVFGRDVDAEGPSSASIARAAEVEAALRARLGERVHRDARPERGDLVLDVVVHEDELVAGLHRHALGRWAIAGGRPRIDVPEGTPSRAYGKLEEALLFCDVEMRAGERAVELGSAPGGMTLAMLKKGVNVASVDPGAMDPGVLAFVGPGGARVEHLSIPVGALDPARLPKPVDWIVVDMNLAPPVSFRYTQRVIEARRPRRGVVLTLKLNDARARGTIGPLLERFRAMRFSRVHATQLPTNRTELTVIGLS